MDEWSCFERGCGGSGMTGAASNQYGVFLSADLGACLFFSSRRRHTRYWRDWSSDVCSSDLCSKERERFNQEVIKPEAPPLIGTEGLWEEGREVKGSHMMALSESLGPPSR